jgi:hypothetical protein
MGANRPQRHDGNSHAPTGGGGSKRVALTPSGGDRRAPESNVGTPQPSRRPRSSRPARWGVAAADAYDQMASPGAPPQPLWQIGDHGAIEGVQRGAPAGGKDRGAGARHLARYVCRVVKDGIAEEDNVVHGRLSQMPRLVLPRRRHR